MERRGASDEAGAKVTSDEDYSAQQAAEEAYESAVFSLRSEGATWDVVRRDVQVIALLNLARPYVRRLNGDGLSREMVKTAYARHCRRVGAVSDGPMVKDHAIANEAMRALASAGWSVNRIAAAFGTNVKTVATTVRASAPPPLNKG